MAVPTYAGIIIDILVVLILVFSFLGGLKKGAVKGMFGLLAFVIALSFTGTFIFYVLGWMTFAPDYLWRALLSFVVTMCVISIIMHLVLLLPRHMLDNIWNGGFVWNALGGIFDLINSALGMVLMVILLDMYPVLPWLNDLLDASNVLNWLVSSFGSVILTLMHMTGTY